jgi:hypothetical protein
MAGLTRVIPFVSLNQLLKRKAMNEKESEELLEWALDEINDVIITIKTLSKHSRYNLNLVLLRKLIRKHIKF